MKLTEEAKLKVTELIQESQIAIPDRKLFLRLSVQPGGCSGLRYQTMFDYDANEDDSIFNYEGFDLRIDKMSVPYLDGAIMDFENKIDKQGFTIDNPNAGGSCSCGDSFH